MYRVLGMSAGELNLIIQGLEKVHLVKTSSIETEHGKPSTLIELV